MLHVFVGCGCLVLLGGLGCSFVHVFVFVVVVGKRLVRNKETAAGYASSFPPRPRPPR